MNYVEMAVRQFEGMKTKNERSSTRTRYCSKNSKHRRDDTP